MDELLQEFLTETGENLDTVDRELVRFEQDPNNRDILRNIFRLVHTVKGTCGFIGLPRLEALTHAAESVIGQFRDGATVKPSAVTAILETIDRIKDILAELAEKGQEPEGNDETLIGELFALAEHAKGELKLNPPADPSLDPVAAYLARHGQAAPVASSAEDIIFRSAPGPQRGPDGRIEGTEIAAPAEETHGPARSSNPGPATLRVNVDTIEHLMTMVSELVLTRNQLLEVSRRQEDAGLKAPLQRLSLITAELQDGVMKTRMQPIGNAWSKLPRIVRDLSAELGKRIELITEGAETELDRQILDLIKDPLIHMVRNCADHAIELPADRREAGKPEHGTIRLAAYHEGGSVTISIADDGRGLNIERIRGKAIAKGLATEAELERLSDGQIGRFIFHPGFSTADNVTAVSGRGVGMDVVKANVDSIGGTVDVASRPGLGTTITIKIPLTLAIISALIVVAGEDRYAIPQIAVRELVRAKAGDDNRIEEINGAPVLRLRGRLLPIVSLPGLMASNGEEHAGRTDGEGFIVVTQIGERQFGILVDSVFHTEEIVVKPMSSKLRHIHLFSGNTILGDGTVVLIVDPNGVARLVGAAISEDVEQEPREAAAQVHRGERTTMLVFRAGTGTLQALPLSLVTRLEEIEAGEFQRSGSRTLLHYRGRLVPVTPVADTQLRDKGIQPLVIVSNGDLTVALAVEAIVDIVEDTFELEMAAAEERGIIGSAMIRGRATDVLDLAHYLPLNEPGWFAAGRSAELPGRILLVEPSDFLRDMLGPVLKASGRTIATLSDFSETGLTGGEPVMTAMLDLDRDSDAAFAFAAILRERATGERLRIIGLTTCATPDLHMRAVQAGLDDVVAKFDRRALLSELNTASADLRHAA
ncbi:MULTISPECIES: chemotaxis protein CheW [Bosea]|uniref:hybrid sensor histidine kinase/response regulator n=1 Tax=Bosea TaxID=85413 RepID=UPI0021506392|nr:MULTISPECIES: chemotaxis protein CheW [Bosea]MCR4520075.1 chemotaxis protein CheW [Bosea sp. 47.2.35]MDR6829640.1 two-component system chemotaxis sensor kinase CheA [Bosea robiniae]MDR6896523.1 two-component system chemotaxis sensor kinase CheA [Bosea sp. BE109]MDR7139921.1 two-component system chemotaxis sensor kinase CheA [Bosea sp. BE168]MDR7176765.1 two-component system chemotaxis sensor kinase CheA [Bosea sp. BE271]